MCVCYCSNSDMNLKKFAAAIEYKGFKKNSNSCSCEDFLIPRLHSSQTSLQVNKTCEFCDCKGVSESKCINGKVASNSLILIVASTICVLFLALFVKELLLNYIYEPRIYCLIPKKKGYEKIGENLTVV
ncbi:hypothetical protein TNIN_382001 [Trichonephila inaurata madagascariensis]|uniref:Uncharacterized protein n=1 Tax=Trichonephila inaurata madagascariensis TaxID=2747483 RepID=A0A8X6Y709_9ARAC|nr:hypothetical protein TNIN_382001 [Trichonephila inaurata madagascariensis]